MPVTIPLVMSTIKEFRAKYLSNPVIGSISSLKLTVISLFILGVQVFCGTLDQINNGLYLAQEKYFNSLIVLLGWVPIPSARIMMWLLFINLCAALLFRFNYTRKNLGIIISHIGLVILLASGFTTLHFSQESFVSLEEGERSNIASDYMKWELVVINETTNKRIIHNERVLKHQGYIDAMVSADIKNYYINSQYFDTPYAGRILKELPIEKEFEKNIRGIVLELQDKTEDIITIKLQGDTDNIYSLDYHGSQYLFILRRKQYKLPFSIELVDITRKLHPGTDIAKSYSSKVVIHDQDLSRPLTISMNKPFRSGPYTAYQASYGRGANGKELSVFAVVRNLNYTLPYIGSLITALGLFIYFITMFLSYYRNHD